MNIADLRVLVIPSGSDNDITQQSSVEEILACKEASIYPLTDFFKAQNDEELPGTYWSFLIDIVKKDDLTGTNIDGVHYFKNTRKKQAEEKYSFEDFKAALVKLAIQDKMPIDLTQLEEYHLFPKSKASMKLVGYQVQKVNSYPELHPDMEASFCLYSKSQAMEMVNNSNEGEYEIFPYYEDEIEEPTLMFEGDPEQ